MNIHQERRMALILRVVPVPIKPTRYRPEYDRSVGRVQPEFAEMAPCVPGMPTDECAGCARHAPFVRENSKLIRIDASTLNRTGTHCPMHA